MKTIRDYINLIETAQAPLAENTGRSLDNAHQRAVIKINKMLKDPSISPVRRAELEQWKKEQMASMKMARGASIIPKNKLPLPEQGVAEGQATRTCPQCDGSGEDTLDPTKSCRRCGGKGHIPMSPREQGVAEDLIDHDAAEPLARHFAEL